LVVLIIGVCCAFPNLLFLVELKALLLEISEVDIEDEDKDINKMYDQAP
jgi:hypothetical protein